MISQEGRRSEVVIFREKRSDQSGGGKVRLRFSEGGEERAAVFKGDQSTF